MADATDPQTFFRNPYPFYAVLRDRRIFWDARHGCWQATRYEDITLILNDSRFGKTVRESSENRVPTELQQRQSLSRGILNTDPPDHTRIRRLMVKGFSPSRIESMRPVAQQLADRLIDAKITSGAMEIMADLANPIPAKVVGDMLGVPEADRDSFGALSNDVIRYGNDIQLSDNVKARAAVDQFDRYLRQLLEHKRRVPGNDLTTALIQAEDEAGRLTDEELIHNICLLFIAGHESTVNLIGNALIALHQFPEQRQKLRADPSLTRRAVEEFLRFDAPVQQLPRIAREDVEIGGRKIRAGQMVVCILGAANHDPAIYPDADALDIERPFRRSKSFGGGPHFCLGAQLARMEAEIALGTLLRRIPDLELINVESVQYRTNPVFRGPVALYARWTPQALTAEKHEGDPRVRSQLA